MSSPTDWYDTYDQNEYIGDAHLSKNTDEPKTGVKNMKTNITDNAATVAFYNATGQTPELTQVIEWTKQLITDFDMRSIDSVSHHVVEGMIADYADREASHNTYYLNALIAADGGIWSSDWLDGYGYGNSNPSGSLQMDEVLVSFVYELTVAVLIAYIDMVSDQTVVVE